MTHIHAAWKLASNGFEITLITEEGKPYWVVARHNEFLFTCSETDSIIKLYNRWKNLQPQEDKPKICRRPLIGDPWDREHLVIPM